MSSCESLQSIRAQLNDLLRANGTWDADECTWSMLTGHIMERDTVEDVLRIVAGMVREREKAIDMLR